MKNAASYMTSEAQEGAIAFGSIDVEDMSLNPGEDIDIESHSGVPYHELPIPGQ